MTSKPGLLARMLGRGSRAPVVASLAAAVLNQPLLVQPTIGEALVGGYLEGKVTSDDSVLKADRFEVSGADGQPVGVAQKLIGVINLSGAMVNRPMPGASGPGPVSYAAVRDTFDELLNDDAVTSIILRLDTPGGMALTWSTTSSRRVAGSRCMRWSMTMRTPPASPSLLPATRSGSAAPAVSGR
jgi:capsid assembly protease